MEKIRNIKKIVSVGQDELSEHDFSLAYSPPYVGKVEADLLVYAYKNEGYDGTGVAAWRHKGKWAYQYLGHCSCNGPTENMRTSDAAKFSLTELKKILLSKENSWSPEYKMVADYLKKRKA